MTSTYLHMQGAQYAYKIKYEDINSLFLLPKADGGRMAFVISLEKPIRQGNQKYQNLVLETHKVETTMRLNLTEEEINSTYDGQLAAEMTMPMSSLIAKIFKVLSQKKVFIPKQYQSAREQFSVRCSVKANDGLLYPLAKSFIFINKPTIIIKFEDIDYVEFKRYEPAANSGGNNLLSWVLLQYIRLRLFGFPILLQRLATLISLCTSRSLRWAPMRRTVTARWCSCPSTARNTFP